MKIILSNSNSIFHPKIMSDAVVNWESIVHKNVRSKDGQDAGKWAFLEIQ